MRAFLLLASVSRAIGSDPILELGAVEIVGKPSTLEIHPSAGPSVLTVSDNGNVGIGFGIASPITALQIGSTDGNHEKARIALISDGSRLDIGHWDGVNNRIESSGKPFYLTSYSGDITLHKQAGGRLQIGSDGVGVTGKVEINGASGGDKTLQVDGNGAFFSPSIILGPSGGGKNGQETGILFSYDPAVKTLGIHRYEGGAEASKIAYMNDDGLFPVKNPGAGYVFSQRAINSGNMVAWNNGHRDVSVGQDFDIRIMTAYLPDAPAPTLPLKVKFTCIADVLTSGDIQATAKLWVQSKGHGVSNDKQDFEWTTGWHHAYWNAAYLLSTPYVAVPMQNSPQTSRDGASYVPPTFSFGVRPESSYGVRLWDCEMVYMHADQQSGRGMKGA